MNIENEIQRYMKLQSVLREENLEFLQSLFREKAKKLLHGTNIDCADAIMDNGLWVYTHNLEHTTREIDTKADDPSILAEYFYTAAFEPYDSRFHTNALISLPNELGDVDDPEFRQNVIELSGEEIPEGQCSHYNGKLRRIVSPEFVRGICNPFGEFTSNPKWLMGLKNAEQILEWHKKRMHSKKPLEYGFKKPALEFSKG